MSSHPPSRKPGASSRYSAQQPLSSMATPRRPETPKKGGLGGFIFAILILAGIIWLLMLIFGWGPYKVSGEEATPTVTATLLTGSPSTATATQSPGLTPTITPAPTFTVTITSTSEPLPFQLNKDPEVFSSALLRPELGCEWLVVAGQVWDLTGEEIPRLTLHLFGELAGYTIDQYMISGSAPVYGESGYEFALENMVVDSEDSLYIQLEDTNGLALSHPYAIETFADCQKNLILVNFKQVR